MEAIKITITRRADDWHCCLTDDRGTWECAKTRNEAIGKLMVSLAANSGTYILIKE